MFIQAFTTNWMTSDFLSSISPGWVVMFLDSHKLQKHLESFSDHSLSCYLNLVKYRFKNGDLVYKLRGSNTKQISSRPALKWSNAFNVESMTQWSSRGDRSCAWPFYGLYISFLKHCTLTNKAMGHIWRDLSKPPHRRQGPILVPSDC